MASGSSGLVGRPTLPTGGFSASLNTHIRFCCGGGDVGVPLLLRWIHLNDGGLEGAIIVITATTLITAIICRLTLSPGTAVLLPKDSFKLIVPLAERIFL